MRHLDLSRLFDVDEFLKDEEIRSEKDFRLLGRVSSFVPVGKHKLIGLSGKFFFSGTPSTYHREATSTMVRAIAFFVGIAQLSPSLLTDNESRY